MHASATLRRLHPRRVPFEQLTPGQTYETTHLAAGGAPHMLRCTAAPCESCHHHHEPPMQLVGEAGPPASFVSADAHVAGGGVLHVIDTVRAHAQPCMRACDSIRATMHGVLP